MKKFFLLLTFAIFLGISSLCFAVNNEQAPSVSSTEDTSVSPTINMPKELLKSEDSEYAWESFFKTRRRILIEISQENTRVKKKLAALKQDTEEAVEQSRKEFSHILALVETSTETPSLLVPLDDRLEALKLRLKDLLAPIDAAILAVDGRLSRLGQATKYMDLLQTEIEKEFEDDLLQYKLKLQRTIVITQALSNALLIIKSSGSELLDRTVALHTTVTTNLPLLWRKHYFTPSPPYFNPSVWKAIPTNLERVIEYSIPYIKSEIPKIKTEWETCLLRFFLAMFFLSIFARLVRNILLEKLQEVTLQQVRIHETSLQADQTEEAGLSLGSMFLGIKQAYKGVMWIALALALHFASSAWEPGHDGFRVLVVPANIALFWGEITLAWALRNICCNHLPSPSPFGSAFFMISTSLIILFFNPPLPLLGFLWLICVCVSLFRHKSFKKKKELDSMYTLEAIALALKPFILWISFAIAFLGWGRLAILLYMAFVGISISLQLGYGSIKIMEIASNYLPKNQCGTLLAGILLGIAAPIMLLIVASLVILWVIAYPGGAYALEHLEKLNFTLGTLSFDLLRILFIVTTFYLVRSFSVIGVRFLEQLHQRCPRFDKRMIHPAQTALKYALWGGFLLYTLNTFGLQLENIALMAGGLGVGIGLGLQGLVNNIISGIILIFGRNLQEDDIIDLGTAKGIVRKVNLRSTTVETFDNAVIFIPNTELVSNRLTNWTRNSTIVRQEINVGVAYGSDIALVQKLLAQVASEHPNIAKSPPPDILFNNFGPSSLDFLLRIWLKDINHAMNTCSDLRVCINKLFLAHNVEIAFPQIDLHLRSDTRMQIL